MKTFLYFSFSLFLAFSVLAQKVDPTYKQVSYGPHEDMTLNFWKIESKNPTPLLVHIHGGGWLGGKKNETVAPNLLKNGYTIISSRNQRKNSQNTKMHWTKSCPYLI